MDVRTAEKDPPWLMLTFTLPAKRASQRVEVWRLLQRYGVIALGNSGYLLPSRPANRERFQWLSSTIRSYKGEVWVTRPKPGIDRSASAWLILRFIDSKARFAFAEEGKGSSSAIPFDMYHGGFGHRGDDCTFETLQKEFRIRDSKVSVIGQMVHD